ncbi:MULTISPECIES: tol-pal system protein YbgF [unclassified Vibrio]|uniref:Cell division coordinator CpoB n=1 Tax=Vibrio sp. HB236076 TaxID=3232307 RepID=A0AB39HJ63_9VIBR|nr:tol-pal system protein YbgF [Vibrio sp. HB161653]MDP5255031.1 tol-pal system protein YbgF [Vibrio sp. HB161653]
MSSNFKRAISLVLLASAASPVLAAPAPVSDLNGTVNYTSSASTTANETDVERLERLLKSKNILQARMQQQIDQMSQDISTLRGQMEKQNYDMQQMVERQRDLYVELDKLRSEVKNRSTASVSSGDADSVANGTYSASPDEQKAYQDAVDLILKERDYDGAINAFNAFQSDYPNSSFSPNAHYWLGQLYYAKKQDTDAAKSFAAVLKFEQSNKRPDALVKLGDIAARNNRSDQANKYYQQAVDQYPESSSAQVAKSKLSQ